MIREEELAHLYASIQGPIYKAISIAGVGERAITHWVHQAKFPVEIDARINFLRTIKKECESFVEFYDLHSPEVWDNLDKNHPDKKFLTKKKAHILKLWRAKPIW